MAIYPLVYDSLGDLLVAYLYCTFIDVEVPAITIYFIGLDPNLH